MSLRTNGKDRLEVSGALTFETVPGLFQDSAGLALLLEWQALAKNNGSSLAFAAAPSDLLRLAELSESKSLLGLTAREAPDGENTDETEI